jgi:hypothetical protein
MIDVTLEHLRKQFITLQDNLKKRQEKEKLLQDHFWDLSHKDKIPKHIIQTTKKPFQDIQDTFERAIYILMISRAFTIKEIARIMNKDRRTILSMYRRTLASQ